MSDARRDDPLAYSLGRRKGAVPRQRELGTPKATGRRAGLKPFMLHMPPDLHKAVQLRKTMTGEDMGDIMVGILTEAMADELAMVRGLAGK